MAYCWSHPPEKKTILHTIVQDAIGKKTNWIQITVPTLIEID